MSQWGAAYDVQIKREMWLGKPMVFFVCVFCVCLRTKYVSRDSL